jgi:hypothetical protein
MKSGRQRRAEIKSKRANVREKAETRALAQARAAELAVNTAALRPTNSYDTPDFVARGYYVDRPFVCKDCGKSEVWTATQQKWWYETAKGDVWKVAVRCRPCRRRERERKAAARKVHLEGLARRSHDT